MTTRRFSFRHVLALLAVLFSAIATFSAPLPAPAATTKTPATVKTFDNATTPGGDTIVFIGMGALRWRDITPSTTPYLWMALHGEQAGAGSLVVRTVKPLTCPADGWLTLGAGQRITTGKDTPCHALATFRNELPWAELRDINEHTHYGAELGLLAKTLQENGLSGAAIGPGATLALTDPDGMPPKVSYPAVVASQTIGNQTAALITKGEADLVLIDAAAGADDVTGLTTGARARPSPADLVIAKRVDTRLGAALRGIQQGVQARGKDERVRVVFASMHDRYNRPFLHFYGEITLTAQTPIFTDPPAAPAAEQRNAAVAEPREARWVSDPHVYAAGSASTRQHSLSQTTDLLPTLLDRLDVQVPYRAVGTPIALGNVATALHEMQSVENDIDRHIDRSRAAVPLLYPLFVLTVLALVVVAAQLLRHPRIEEVEAGTHGGLAWWAAIPIAVPLGVYLVDMFGWWRLDGPMIGADAAAIIGALGALAAAALLAAIALAIPAIPAICLLAASLWVVIVGDALTGAHLQRTAIMGSFATVGGRFYGVNNTAFTLLLVSSLILAASLAAAVRAKWRPVVIALVGLVTVTVDGAPMWGADFGGPPAIIPAFVVLGLLVAGMKVTWRRIMAIGLFTVVVVAAVAAVDWLRPETSRTHLGHLVTAALNGDLGTIITRKIGGILQMLLAWQALAVLAAIILLASLLLRGILATSATAEHADDDKPGLTAAWRRTWATLRADYRSAALPPIGNAAVVAIVIGLVLGFLLNDSGPAIITLGGALLISSYLSFTHESLRAKTRVTATAEDDDANAQTPADSQLRSASEVKVPAMVATGEPSGEMEAGAQAPAKSRNARPGKLRQAGKLARRLPVGVGIRNLVALRSKRQRRKDPHPRREEPPSTSR